MNRNHIAIFIWVLGVLLINWLWYYRVHFYKGNPVSINKVVNDVYEEKYSLSKGGVLANDLYACYLTDSMMFRKFVGRYDDKERYLFKIIGTDTIKAVKYTRRIHYSKFTAIDSSLFSISSLKKAGDFD